VPHPSLLLTRVGIGPSLTTRTLLLFPSETSGPPLIPEPRPEGLRITWPESVDCALSFGCIDGVRKSLGENSYMIRFTPRKPGSTWSAINIRRLDELAKTGLMHRAGLAAYAKRSDKKSAIYAYERRQTAQVDAASEKRFCANKKAWQYFRSQRPGIAEPRLMGDQREEERDEAEAAGDTYRRFGAGEKDQATGSGEIREELIDQSFSPVSHSVLSLQIGRREHWLND
jgi:hypothetical protein